MIDFYFNAAPNPMKVALFLEESGIDYRAVPVDTKLGQQHTPAFACHQSQRQGASIDRR